MKNTDPNTLPQFFKDFENETENKRSTNPEIKTQEKVHEINPCNKKKKINKLSSFADLLFNNEILAL